MIEILFFCDIRIHLSGASYSHDTDEHSFMSWKKMYQCAECWRTGTRKTNDQIIYRGKQHCLGFHNRVWTSAWNLCNLAYMIQLLEEWNMIHMRSKATDTHLRWKWNSLKWHSLKWHSLKWHSLKWHSLALRVTCVISVPCSSTSCRRMHDR